jgi:hypothetical protein
VIGSLCPGAWGARAGHGLHALVPRYLGTGATTSEFKDAPPSAAG